uniref:uncharacterized protein LOC108949670 n=1 Tax=Ciona intestinalis TaxID=7719 RepID=UPI00089DB9A3|nr:uncharacterized protein LOC108949670 [Ciona intestinalis]|eukprot:XP_018668282.1 uncharacterized protein LOC108949670 [Ciona intestinalis]
MPVLGLNVEERPATALPLRSGRLTPRISFAQRQFISRLRARGYSTDSSFGVYSGRDCVTTLPQSAYVSSGELTGRRIREPNIVIAAYGTQALLHDHKSRPKSAPTPQHPGLRGNLDTNRTSLFMNYSKSDGPYRGTAAKCSYSFVKQNLRPDTHTQTFLPKFSCIAAKPDKHVKRNLRLQSSTNGRRRTSEMAKPRPKRNEVTSKNFNIAASRVQNNDTEFR